MASPSRDRVDGRIDPTAWKKGAPRDAHAVAPLLQPQKDVRPAYAASAVLAALR